MIRGHTWFEGLDGNWRSSIPHSGPHLPKVPSTQLLLKLEGGAINLPLIPAIPRDNRERESKMRLSNNIASSPAFNGLGVRLFIKYIFAYL